MKVLGDDGWYWNTSGMDGWGRWWMVVEYESDEGVGEITLVKHEWGEWMVMNHRWDRGLAT